MCCCEEEGQGRRLRAAIFLGNSSFQFAERFEVFFRHRLVAKSSFSIF